MPTKSDAIKKFDPIDLNIISGASGTHSPSPFEDIERIESIKSAVLAVDEQELAQRNIEKKAKSLGDQFTGPAVWADVSFAGDGVYYREYRECDIYWHRNVGAFEIRGEIRKKYNSYGDRVSRFGMPVTDETATADGEGGYNHFAKRTSIYWHPDTGPFHVRGEIRKLWADRGWERGPLGYPVVDQFLRDDGQACAFQNGALSTDDKGNATDAVVASLTRDQLLTLIWRRFDELVRQGPEEVRLHSHKSMDEVSATGFGFWAARNRTLTVTINGFRKNGLATDTDWAAHLNLLLFVGWRKDGSAETLVAHRGGSVEAHGIFSETISDSIVKAISKAFGNPIRIGETIPKTANFITLLVRADGGVDLYFTNTVQGRLARLIVEGKMEKLLE